MSNWQRNTTGATGVTGITGQQSVSSSALRRTDIDGEVFEILGDRAAFL